MTRNLLRIAIFSINYNRGLFPEKYFNDKSVPALDMKIKKLMPLDAESRRLNDWMEKDVYDALQKKYQKTLMFYEACICEAFGSGFEGIRTHSSTPSILGKRSRRICARENGGGGGVDTGPEPLGPFDDGDSDVDDDSSDDDSDSSSDDEDVMGYVDIQIINNDNVCLFDGVVEIIPRPSWRCLMVC